jgi:hypothetical protein
VTPHVARNVTNRKSTIDGRTTGHPGYEISQRLPKRIGEPFDWLKTVGGLRKTRHKGMTRVDWSLHLRHGRPQSIDRNTGMTAPAVESGAAPVRDPNRPVISSTWAPTRRSPTTRANLQFSAVGNLQLPFFSGGEEPDSFDGSLIG